MADEELPGALRDELRAAWHRYVDLTAPHRPALHAHCRELARDPWRAEDLVQETMLRAFASLGSVHHAIRSPRAYLLRTATLLWVDGPGRRLRSDAEPARDADDRESASPARRAAPPSELVDRFVALLRAGDAAGLVALMHPDGQIENVGCGLEFGGENFPRESGWIHAAVHGHPEWPAPLQPEAVRVERALFAGEPVALGLVTRHGREALEQVLRIEERDGRIARLRAYAFCPETMREVGAALGLRVRTGLYRYPTPAPGRSFAAG